MIMLVPHFPRAVLHACDIALQPCVSGWRLLPRSRSGTGAPAITPETEQMSDARHVMGMAASQERILNN
jgi:hypothetical protein